MAALCDGELQHLEHEIIKNILDNPECDISEEDFWECARKSYDALNSGVPNNLLLQSYANDLNEKESQTVYALAYEICSSNYILTQQEKEFLNLLEKFLEIDTYVKTTVRESIQFRYGL